MLAITGVEGDYDAEHIDPETAIATLTTAGLLAIVCTTPSHTSDAPRWRVYCPLSCEYPTSERDRLMARLSGLFGGVFSRESWAISQAYFYGSINRSPSHVAQLIEGTPIDLMDNLDAGAIGRPNGNGSTTPTATG